MNDAERMKEKRRWAKAEGFCQKCFIRIAMPQHALCGVCDELAEEYKAKRRTA